ncbi:MAG: flagellar motor protein MotB [Planctomycetota bacterium]
MAKKHKHEEHVNHERWLVSFADMMTLLFALFVVLYALGQANLEKLKQLRESIQWAFNLDGSGKTKDTGIFERPTGGGEVIDGPPLVTAQDGEMRELLKQELEKFEDIAGKSLEIVQTDDTTTFTGPMSDFFDKGSADSLKRQVAGWLERVLVASHSFTSDFRVVVKVPEVPIEKGRNGVAVTSVDLAIRRLRVLERVILRSTGCPEDKVSCEWKRMVAAPGMKAWLWEDQATVSVAFTNAHK